MRCLPLGPRKPVTRSSRAAGSAEEQGGAEGEVGSLKELFESYYKPEGSMMEEGEKSGDEKRNFFAHSGLPRELVTARNEGRNVSIKYSEKHLNKIEGWLMKPE